MRVVDWLDELGRVAARATLLRLTSRTDVDRALSLGDVERVGRGRYALPRVTEARRAAHALGGVLSHTSAAQALGWELKRAPERPHVLVPEKRKVPAALRLGVELHRGMLPTDPGAAVTPVDVTLMHCLRTLPFDEALAVAVADSALRRGVPPSTLLQVAASARGPGAPRIRQVCALARSEPANPFESVLRAIALEVGLHVCGSLPACAPTW